SRPDVSVQTVDRAFALSSPADLEAHGVKAEAVTYRGRPAVRLNELPGNGQAALAILKGTSFKDGTIEVELAGLPAAGAAKRPAASWGSRSASTAIASSASTFARRMGAATISSAA